MNSPTVVLLASCFLLIGFQVAATSNSTTTTRDYRLFATATPRKACSSSGVMCSDCGHLTSCIADGEGGFTEIPVQTCPSGQTCLGQECTEASNPACEALENYKFDCKSSGMFPDPFDCHTYYFCLPGTTIPQQAECDVGYGYHAGTTYCQRKLTGDVCSNYVNDFPVPLCVHAGQTASLWENPSMYYTCVAYNVNGKDVLYPFLYVCPHGGTYYDYSCHPTY